MSRARSQLGDPRLEPYVDLRRDLGRDRDPQRGPGRFIVEGSLAVGRLLSSSLGFQVESVVCTPSQGDKLAALHPGCMSIPMLELERSEIAELLGFDFHRGVLACGLRPPVSQAFSKAQLAAFRSRDQLTIVAGVGLADPRNLGALVRNAAAFGVDAVIADARGADIFARLTIRASVGNVFRIPTLVTESIESSVQLLAAELGAELVAGTPDASATTLADYQRPGPVIVLVGNEGAGLSVPLLERADARLRIPVDPDSDSINVAAATAVLLYELCARA